MKMYYSVNFNQYVINKLGDELKNNKTVTVEGMWSYFDDILDDEGFFQWFMGSFWLQTKQIKRAFVHESTKWKKL